MGVCLGSNNVLTGCSASEFSIRGGSYHVKYQIAVCLSLMLYPYCRSASFDRTVRLLERGKSYKASSFSVRIYCVFHHVYSFETIF